MVRVNVSLKDKLLREVDAEAKGGGISRSALVQAALEEYLQAKRKKRDEMKEASGRLDRLAKELGHWDPQAIIRKFRDTNLKGE